MRIHVLIRQLCELRHRNASGYSELSISDHSESDLQLLFCVMCVWHIIAIEVTVHNAADTLRPH